MGLKLETTQPTGAFKVRGAANAILRAVEGERPPGIVTASTGNHAMAVTYVARTLDIPVVVCLASDVPADRIDDLERAGATVEMCGDVQDDAIGTAAELGTERGYVYVSPFDDPDVISGQGTIGLELLEDLPRLDAVVVPVSGGGLSAGLGIAVHAVRPGVRVIGVGAEGAPAMHRSLQAGTPVDVSEHTMATSLLGGIGLDNQYTFRLNQRHLDDLVLLPDDEIVDTVAWAAGEERLLIEGAAATTLAYLRREPADVLGSTTAAVITGDRLPRARLADVGRSLLG